MERATSMWPLTEAIWKTSRQSVASLYWLFRQQGLCACGRPPLNPSPLSFPSHASYLASLWRRETFWLEHPGLAPIIFVAQQPDIFQ